MRLVGKYIAAAALTLFALAIPASASAQVQPYGANDYGGFRNILPPGEGTTVNAAGLLAFELNGTLPPHYDDQRLMYQNLIHATPGLTDAQINDYYKDGSFGVKPADVARTYQPDNAGHPGLTVVRDNYGVPHVYGTTRPDVMFGAGYDGAEDRLFFMDVLRHAGRAQLASFAGGSNKAMDAEQWDVAPYTEQDLQRQIDLADEVYGQEGISLQQDLNDYVAGINKYISEAQANATLMPGEYAAIGQPLGPTAWKGTDVIATASLIGGIFGKGGGEELANAEVYKSAIAKFGGAGGTAAWQDFRRANDPEAPTTVHNGTSFPYQDRPNVAPESNPAVALPDTGSLVDGSPDDAPNGGHGLLDGILGGLPGMQGASNALLVSAAHSQSGHPEVVFGPQVGYFAPQILMEEDLHGPDIDARGATFTGVNLYVLLGRGQDYAWSATSAGQDIIDTFAEKLCEPDGPDPGTEPDPGTISSMNYLYKGECRPIEVLNRDQTIVPSAADDNGGNGIQTFHLQAQRTVHGIISKRGTVNGDPVAFAKLRSTYFHEADSARAFSQMNQPSMVQSATDFQHVMSKTNFTFNWFYVDDRDIAYFNSGDNPVRAAGTDPEFPAWGTGQYDWQGWDPVLPENGTGLAGGTNIADYTPFSQHPQVINQDYLSSWNNKQAPGYRAAEDNYSYGPNHRVQSLNERIEAGISGGKKMSLADLISAMEDGGSVDLRGSQALPLMLDVIDSSGSLTPSEQSAVNQLRAWVASGAHRRDNAPQDSHYDNADAIAILDAWWPKALTAAFKPALGDDLFNKVQAEIGFDDPPGPLGSSYIAGWEGYVNKDLRDLLGRSVLDPFSRGYCGEGVLATCRSELLTSLDGAIDQAQNHPEQLYPQAGGCFTGGGGDSQMCHDAIQFRPIGAVSVKPMEWINRPTWQQVVEVQGHRGRSTPISPGGPTETSPPAGGTHGARKKCRHRKKHHHGAKAAKKKRCKKKRR
jgi:acyl-homoserine lactone acylase PvdQ